ncbi:MAG: redoxin domain-containing protein, partial [Myxococcales bacterium]|nr:redoxin domain-containing protein [Myxococcales bacterium]
MMLFASILVAFLAARGQFTSVMGFPYVFGGVILLFGSLSLRKQRDTAMVPRIVIVAIAAAVPFGGGVAQGRLVERQRAESELSAMTLLADTPAAPLAGLRPVNPGTASAAETLFDGKVTIITFWTTWCSPCRRELSEFQTLYQANRDV